MTTKIAATLILIMALIQQPAQAPALQSDAAHKASELKLPGRITPKTSRTYVKQAAAIAGYKRKDWKCLDEIVWRESRWHYQADNPHSSAFGLFQQLTLDPDTGLRKQTIRGLRYIEHRYADKNDTTGACTALQFHNKNGWY